MYKAAVLLVCASASLLRAAVIKGAANLKEVASATMLRAAILSQHGQERGPEINHENVHAPDRSTLMEASVTGRRGGRGIFGMLPFTSESVCRGWWRPCVISHNGVCLLIVNTDR